MALTARHPDTLRAVVLDSVYPPNPLPRSRNETFEAALEHLFDACRSDPDCAATHPDLATLYRETLARLRLTPLTADLPSAAGPGRISLGPTVFVSIVNRMLCFPSLPAQIPAVIQAAHDGDATAIRPLIARIVAGYATISAGTMLAVDCRDRPPPPDPLPPSLGDDSMLAWMPGPCRAWDVVPSPPPLPRDTPVPSLLLAGGLDPVTPPDFAALAAVAMGPKATMVVFPTRSHDIEETTPRRAGLITHFIQAPDAALDTSCVARVPPVRLR